MGFSNILKAELYKLAKSKALIKIAIAVIIIFIASSVLYGLLYNLIEGIGGFTIDGDITEEMVKASEEAIKDAEATYNSENALQQMHDTGVYQAKAMHALYKYMYENHLSFSSASVFGVTMGLSTNGYMTFMLQIMSAVIIIFATITIVRSVAGERSNGTLKMQLLRPIKKEEMIGAKILATWIVSIFILLFTFILSAIVGICAFKMDAKQVLMVINATKVVSVAPFVEQLILLISNIGTISAYIVLGTFLSLLVKKSEGAAIAIAMVVVLIGDDIESLLGYIFVGYVGVNINLGWTSALSISGPALNHMNLYTMLAISIMWTAVLLTSSIFMFKKLEVHN